MAAPHKTPPAPWSKNKIEGRLLILAALFLILHAAGLTLAPAVREGDWTTPLNWGHWAGLGIWLVLFGLAHWQHRAYVPTRDPYLLPAAGLLVGWGMLTIWRLLPDFGARQAVWLLVGGGVYLLGLRMPRDLRFLRRYKYLWLTGGLILTALTLVFGVNPMGFGPRMWLGCCGMYIQPSEPLKLLLIVYLAAYLSSGSWSGRERLPVSPLSARLLPLLAPTLFMTGLALALLVSQADLGTASIFLFIYTAVVYVASGRWKIAAAGAGLVGLSAVLGYVLFDVVRLRVDAWLNPWLDPSGSSYQVVQSLLAVAAGGIFGRGPGLGAARLVPLAHSDFIYAAVVEETGLIGAIGLLLALALLAGRAMLAAIQADDSFRRYLAAGLAAYIAGQSVLIIGGNVRLLPLTGVTIPFVSYGGSSLLTAFIALVFLIHISARQPDTLPRLYRPAPYLHLAGLLLLGLGAAGVLTGWWAVVRAPDLLARTDNARRSIADRYTPRGGLLDRSDRPLNVTVGERGAYSRSYAYPDLAPILGYTHPVYGQAGLEAVLDPYLRGLRGYSQPAIWVHMLLYGTPPPGLDVRLSLDAASQAAADDLLGDSTGAVALLAARSGEILALASHPTYDPSQLESLWPSLVQDPAAPLLNRAAAGLYPAGSLGAPFLLAELEANGSLPELPRRSGLDLNGSSLECALPARPGVPASWGSLVSRGCPAPAAAMGEALGGPALLQLYARLGWTEAQTAAAAARLPLALRLDTTAFEQPGSAAVGQGVFLNPLQAALAGASLSNGGVLPPPHLVLGVNLPDQGWTTLLPGMDRREVLDDAAALGTADALQAGDLPLWQIVTVAPNGPDRWVTWYLGGTLLGTTDTPRTVAVVLEERDPQRAQSIGQALLLLGR